MQTGMSDLPHTIYRVFVRAAIWLLLVLLLCAGSWLAGNRLLDEPALGGREVFLVSNIDEIPDRQNIAIGLLGLTAPGGVDIFDYGSRIAEFYRVAYFPEIRELKLGAKTLQPTLDPFDAFCWLYSRTKQTDDCLPFEDLPEILRDNAKLLERFRSLHRLDHYSNRHNFLNVGLIDVKRLAIAEIHLHVERGEESSRAGSGSHPCWFSFPQPG